jgi:hypothetical protein
MAGYMQLGSAALPDRFVQGGLGVEPLAPMGGPRWPAVALAGNAPASMRPIQGAMGVS